MLARNDIEAYVTDTYGACTRPLTPQGENACYWGKDARGQWNGCLRTGWRGMACAHWQPIEGQARDDLINTLTVKS